MSFDLDGLDGLLPPPGAPKGRPVPAAWAAEPSTQVGAPSPVAPLPVAAVTGAALPVDVPPAPVVEAPVLPPPSIAPHVQPAPVRWTGFAAAGLAVLLGVGAGTLWLLSRGLAPPVVSAPEPVVVAPEPVVVAPEPVVRPPDPVVTEPVAPWTVPFVLRSTKPVGATVPAALLTCTSVRVVGHTCDLGDPASNERIGLARAEAVRDLLVSAGLPAARIHLSSAGEAQPLDTAHTPDARARNRRVEVSCTQEP